MPLSSGTWSIATIKVALRDRKFTYCRPQIFNHLTTDDTFWHCLTLAVWYQLVQAVLKIGFVLVKRWGRGGGRGFQYRVAALAGRRTALIGTGWIIFQHFITMGNHSPPLVRALFLGL